MPSRFGRTLCIVVLVAGCGDNGTPGGTAPGDATREDGLMVSGPVTLGQALLPLRHRFRQQGLKVGAAGPRHQIELGAGVTRVRALLTASEVRQWRMALLPSGTRGVAFPKASRTSSAKGGATTKPALQPTRATRPSLASAFPRVGAAASTWELTTRSLGRTGFECVKSQGTVTVATDGVAHRAFSGCREEWTNGPQGSEVAYQLAERPPGAGDLRVTVDARLGTAPALVSSDAKGLHFQSATGARFIYGHATWVDAAGHRTAVPAHWNGDAIELVVPAGVVDASGYPATLDPIVGPDLGTDTPVLTQASAGSEPAVASDGSQFLAVFGDAQRIRAVRVDAAGHVLERDWLDLGEDGMVQFQPAVAFGGGHYLVAWWQDDGTNVSIRGRLVNPDGSLVGTSSFALSSQTGFDAAVAWNGSAFLASWLGFDDLSAIRVATVDSEGHVVPGSEHVVSGNGFTGHPAIAVGSTTAVVTWEDGTETTDFTNRIKAARLALDGTVLDAGGLRLSNNDGNEDQPRVASDGHGFLVTWHRAGAPGSIQGAVLADTGELVAADFPVSRSTGEVSRPAVAFNGSQFAVAWKDERGVPAIEGTLVSSAGTVEGVADTVLSNVPATPSGSFDSTGLAWNGTQFLLVFQGARPSGGGDIIGIEGSLLGADLTLSPGPLGLSQLPAGELAPSVVWTGRNYLVSWIDLRTGSFEAASSRAVRINAAGQILEPDGLALSDGLPGIAQVASNADGRAAVALTQPGGSALFRFVAADGRLGPTRVLADRILAATSIAGNGNNYLALLNTMHPDFTFDLSVRVLRANGALGAEIPVDTGTNGTGSLVAAGDGYLVSSLTGGGELIHVGANGRVGRTLSLPLAGTSLTSATNGVRTLVAWIPASGELPFAADARFFADGAFRGPTLELAPTTSGSPAALAWDGRTYWAVWPVSVTDAQGSTFSQPFIRSISAGGALGPVSAVFDGPCEGPALASNQRRQLLLSCYAFTNQYRVVTVSTRLVDTSRAAGPGRPAALMARLSHVRRARATELEPYRASSLGKHP